jgi:hypothetical protein
MVSLCQGDKMMKMDDRGIVPVKALVVVALIGLFVGTWIVVLNTAEFKVDIRITNASVTNETSILFGVDVRFTNKQFVDVTIDRLVIQVFASDKVTLLFSNVDSPITNIRIGAQESVIQSISGQIDNVDVVGTVVFVVIDINWSQDGGTFTAHHEKLYDLNQFMSQLVTKLTVRGVV